MKDVWSKEERGILHKYYQDLGPQEIHKRFIPCRTPNAISSYATRKLKLRYFKPENLSGKKYNRLTFIQYLRPQHPRRSIWLCYCDCGKEIEVRADQVISGNTKSCGCLNTETRVKTGKHIGKLFGSYSIEPEKWTESLECLYPNLYYEWNYEKNTMLAHEIKPGSQISVWWKCKECSYEYKSRVDHRAKDFTACPKCSKSKGERKLYTILDKLNVEYETQKYFKGLKYRGPLLFDVYIPKFNICIEYHGKQHYKPARFSSKQTDKKSNEDFTNTQIRDSIKRQYCAKNGIHLIEIPYTEFKNLELIITNIIRSYTDSLLEGDLL